MEPASELLDRNIDEIMMRWEARAFNEVPAAVGQTSLFLRNALPKFLKSLVTLLSKKQRASAQIDFDAAELYRQSKEHGRGCAGVPAYIMSQVIFEYHILRDVILQVMENFAVHVLSSVNGPNCAPSPRFTLIKNKAPF